MRRALAALLLVAMPGVARACAVCGAAAAARSNSAFVGTTILLSLLPLAMVGAGLWWIMRHAGEHLAGEFAERELDLGAPERPAARGEP